jgi:hypothetical protein
MVPATVRPGELARVSWPNAANLRLPVPKGVKELRIWINGASDTELEIAAEGDTDDNATATAAADELKSTLRSNAPGMARLILKPVIDDAEIWADGKVVRYRAKMPENLLDMIAGLVCGRATGSKDCVQ